MLMPLRFSDMQRWQKFPLPSMPLLACLLCAVSGQGIIPQQREVISLNGRNTYVYKPRVAFNTGPRPGIFVLHGSKATPESMFDIGFEELADVHNFLVVYPDMQVPKADAWAFHEDIPYFNAVSERLQQEDFGMDGSRAYVCGHSAGGTMSLFLQNEAETFSAAAAVEAAVGQLQHWNMSRTGRRTMIVWNHADPVLHAYAPSHNESEYYKMTVDVLRRHGSKAPIAQEQLPTSRTTLHADIHHYEPDVSPELLMLSWRSYPGTHNWPKAATFSFDAAYLLTKFFLQVSETQPLVMYT
eukprot:TRINITY_DN2901_c0_g2_i1.p1 TRINITY_DN2901_c0_g2~~TRINITY_DN2901_c0_g2_i1.p1  ORF type:complete len:298 (+),score=40.79 TRINITY_DN2901_c0_g2_i1:102-995(+)